MVARYFASVSILFSLACSAPQKENNSVSYGGNGGEPGGSGGEAGSAGIGGTGVGGSSGSGIAGIGGAISTDGGTDAGISSCATSTATAKAQPAVLELVVDTSGSMNNPAPGGGSKWVATRDALVAALTPIPDGNAVGLFFYPGPDNGTRIAPTPT